MRTKEKAKDDQMKVKLTYFKLSGKYYHNDEYDTSEIDLWKIWNEVEEMLLQGRLPGLVDGAKKFMVLVDVPEHKFNHPHIIFPKTIIKAIRDTMMKELGY